jgi:mRNA interferase MazF
LLVAEQALCHDKCWIMPKDFDAWNELKKRVDGRRRCPRYHEREVWWCSLGLNVGHEEDGKHSRFERPVLVLRKFNREALWALPMTRSAQPGPYRHPLTAEPSGPSTVLLSQLRLISSRRLSRLLHVLPKHEFAAVRAAVRQLLEHGDG